MKEISNLIAYRPDVKVVDATMRDGGLVNDFYFTDEFVKALYLANLRAGVDYMEFGYKASKEMFDESKFGKWKFCRDEHIREIVGENATDLKIAVMADVGRCEKTDILDRADSPIDLIRVATYVNTIPGAVAMIEDAAKKGYEVSCNIMAISHVREGELKAALDILAQTPTDVLYIVDSYGAMYPEEIARFVDMYLEVAAKYGKKVGIHAHNNQQLAFANTIEGCRMGVSLLDATVSGMGRGAGNCYMESLLSFLKNPKYDEIPIIRFVEKHMLKLKAEGVVWGFDIPYLVTGILNSHPSTAIKFIKEERTDYCSFMQELLDLE